MAGIAGVGRGGKTSDVKRMLDALTHRGGAIRDMIEVDGMIIGVTAPTHQITAVSRSENTVRDYVDCGHYAQAQIVNRQIVLIRDPLGVAPLYYGKTADRVLCFASEVKALRGIAAQVAEFPPGTMYRSQRMLPHFRLQPGARLEESAEQIAIELRIRLGSAVQKCLCPDVFGAWLSGGLDSSALVALARPWTKKLHTFAGGLPGAPDLHFARAVAEYLGTEHHEIMLSPKDLLRVLPDVIYHLESFDALLVRSSIVNFMLAKAMAEYVPATLSGEGSDELFAGYEYLKQIPPDKLEDELLDLTARLHNTALQRVDRCASAHGLVAHLCFLDPYVVELALRIPTKFKLYGSVEKWILRKAMAGLLPQTVVERTKSKFWQGSGVGDLLAEHAERTITDNDFQKERQLPNGWTLGTKEELLYYRIFKEWFGAIVNLDWVGRTKNAPRKN